MLVKFMGAALSVCAAIFVVAVLAYGVAVAVENEGNRLDASGGHSGI